MMLGALLARARVDVVVLEKHADFLRDFRGDTVHPSTLEVMHELGWLDDFLKRPHQEVREIGVEIAGERVAIADFTHLPVHARFVALMPQWDFLDFVAERARREPTFRLRMETEVVDLLEDGGRVTGVVAKTPSGVVRIAADLVVGADGRASVVREKAGLEVEDFGAPIDVLWMRLTKRGGDPGQTLGYVARGHVFVMLDRGDYWQCAFVIAKGGADALRQAGIEELRAQIAAIVPWVADRLPEVRTWDDARLLTVRVDRLREWSRPGVLCIGDAAHAMSPIGGVGINLAIQDAVAAANLLFEPLRQGAPSDDDLRRVQRRREWPTRLVQRLQLLAQDRLIGPVIAGATPTVPTFLRLLDQHPRLRRLPARMIGLGFRPEHVSPTLAAY
jgi:2-polyprenyl-6-methoxyphenol hydroxylase-like FAD-dependent oxidoreductase